MPENRKLHPVDRILRTLTGFMAIILAYTIPMTTEYFAELHMVAVYFWVTVLVSNDPFYLFFNKILHFFRERRAIDGKF